MATEEIKKYIKKRYDRWLDYATYHASCAGIPDEAVDVLNEVMCDLLQKPDKKLLSLLHKKSGQYTELDFYVLRMIKLNATSETSPYKHKYRSAPIDENADYMQLEVEDVRDDQHDQPGEILEKMRAVRKTLNELCISSRARKIFEWRFFCGEKFSDWQGSESEKELFDVYYKVAAAVKNKLNNKSLF